MVTIIFTSRCMLSMSPCCLLLKNKSDEKVKALRAIPLSKEEPFKIPCVDNTGEGQKSDQTFSPIVITELAETSSHCKNVCAGKF